MEFGSLPALIVRTSAQLHKMSSNKIAVVGAGPAGLAFARILQQNGIRCTVFEAEPDRQARNQGGTLDLHPRAGQRALEVAGLLGEFKKFARPEGQARRIIKADGTVLIEINGTDLNIPVDDERPEIDREDLRNILLDSLHASTVQWGHKVSRIEQSPETNKHTVHFSDGTTEKDIDLLVGADGAWSKVRPLITDVKPFYSGITAIELWGLNVDKTNPWLSSYVGQGSVFMFDEGRCIICQRNSNNSIRVYAAVRQPESWLEECGIDWSEGSTARHAFVEGFFGDCGEDIKKAILDTKDILVPRKMYMLPVGHKWSSQPSVTLMGDSAHLMTPFAGVGVNVALFDGLRLAQSVLAHGTSDSKSIAAAVKDYEQEMFQTAEQNATKTFKGLRGHFSKNGSEERVTAMRKGLERAKEEMARVAQAGKA